MRPKIDLSGFAFLSELGNLVEQLICVTYLERAGSCNSQFAVRNSQLATRNQSSGRRGSSRTNGKDGHSGRDALFAPNTFGARPTNRCLGRRSDLELLPTTRLIGPCSARRGMLSARIACRSAGATSCRRRSGAPTRAIPGPMATCCISHLDKNRSPMGTFRSARAIFLWPTDLGRGADSRTTCWQFRAGHKEGLGRGLVILTAGRPVGRQTR